MSDPDIKVFNLDEGIKTLLEDKLKNAALFNNCITFYKDNLYFMTFRINYAGVKAQLTDPDSLLHPWNFWDKEKYNAAAGSLTFERVKLTNLLDTEFKSQADAIDNNRFLGTGLALLEYKDGKFIVKSAGNLFEKYGFHDVRITCTVDGPNAKLTFYYTKNDYGDLTDGQKKNAGRRFPRTINTAGQPKHIDVYYAKNVADLGEKFSTKNLTPLDASIKFPVKTFIGKVSYEFDEFDMTDCVTAVNTPPIEPCNIFMNTYIERNWIPTHPKMVYPEGSFFHGLNGILSIITPPSTDDKVYDTTLLSGTETSIELNTFYYLGINKLEKTREYFNQFIDEKTFYQKYKAYPNVLNFSLSTQFIEFPMGAAAAAAPSGALAAAGAAIDSQETEYDDNFVAINNNNNTLSVHEALNITDQTFLSVGHAKIDYRMALDLTKNNANSKNADSFLHSILENISENTRIQNNYIYCMFFFVANKYGIPTHFSDLFIPCGNQVYNSYLNFRISQTDPAKSSSYFLNSTDCNPYLLAFPTGLTKSADGDKIFVSYGEGDCRPKIVEFSATNVKSMLKSASDETRLGFRIIKSDAKVNIEPLTKLNAQISGDKYKLTYKNFNRHMTTLSGGKRRRTFKKRSIRR
jgi:hypothetical protein